MSMRKTPCRFGGCDNLPLCRIRKNESLPERSTFRQQPKQANVLRQNEQKLQSWKKMASVHSG